MPRSESMTLPAQAIPRQRRKRQSVPGCGVRVFPRAMQSSAIRCRAAVRRRAAMKQGSPAAAVGSRCWASPTIGGNLGRERMDRRGCVIPPAQHNPFTAYGTRSWGESRAGARVPDLLQGWRRGLQCKPSPIRCSCGFPARHSQGCCRREARRAGMMVPSGNGT